MANTISEYGMSISSAISAGDGSFEVLLINSSLTFSALYAVSRSDLETLIGLLSRKYLLISPIIIGTAYVENLTLWLKSKLSMEDRKSTRLNSSHVSISYAVFCLKKKRESRNAKV